MYIECQKKGTRLSLMLFFLADDDLTRSSFFFFLLFREDYLNFKDL